MNKSRKEVIEALELCPTSVCAGCPYYGLERCDRALAKDTIALLEATNKPMYSRAIIFTKHTDLMPWFQSNYHRFGTHGTTERIREMYSRVRDVQLILLVRYENNKCICRIKCPINPLPIKGEFEAVNSHEVERLLKSFGWTVKERLSLQLLRQFYTGYEQ